MRLYQIWLREILENLDRKDKWGPFRLDSNNEVTSIVQNGFSVYASVRLKRLDRMALRGIPENPDRKDRRSPSGLDSKNAVT